MAGDSRGQSARRPAPRAGRCHGRGHSIGVRSFCQDDDDRVDGTFLFYLRMGQRPTRNSGGWKLGGERGIGGVEGDGGETGGEDKVGKTRYGGCALQYREDCTAQILEGRRNSAIGYGHEAIPDVGFDVAELFGPLCCCAKEAGDERVGVEQCADGVYREDG